MASYASFRFQLLYPLAISTLHLSIILDPSLT